MRTVQYKTRFSTWEVEWDDTVAVRCRRVEGDHEVTGRTPDNGTWKAVQGVVDLPRSSGLWIQWEGLPARSGTWTSEILRREVISENESK